MARKPRIHFPGAVYHVILRGNRGENIFFTRADRARFYFLLQEGVERFEHRIHAFCLMTNHVHLAIQVGTIPLSRIMQNISFRYTSYINRRKRRTGHVFQGRYKALLIDADTYLLELVRYIHCNPVRAGLAQSPEQYQWSSHRAYMGEESVSWLSTEWILSQFSQHEETAKTLYRNFVLDGIAEEHRIEFHRGTYEGRILGDDGFSENALAKAEEKFQGRLELHQIIDAVCAEYAIDADMLAESGKKQPASKARTIVAYLVQDEEHLSLTELSRSMKRHIAALSRAAGRLRDRMPSDPELTQRVALIRKKLSQKSKCQA